MSKVIKTNDGYLALLDAVYFGGLRIGNISEDGVEWGGEEPQSLEIWAAQVRSNPVKEVQTRAATNEITGKMIQLVPHNCVTLMGGTVNAEGGWDAPANSSIIEGELMILTGTGYTIKAKRASQRMANLRGGLGGDKTLGVEFAHKILAPLDGSSPLSINPTKPFIEADPVELSFDAAGGSKVINIEASGPFAVGAVPQGFTLEVVDGYVTVIALENTTSAQRTGELSFMLISDPDIKVSITLTQSA